MFPPRQSHNLIKKVHERSLKIITDDENSSFETLIQNRKDITVRQRNLQILMIEVYKVIKGEAPSTIKNIYFSEKHSQY